MRAHSQLRINAETERALDACIAVAKKHSMFVPKKSDIRNFWDNDRLQMFMFDIMDQFPDEYQAEMNRG